MAAMSATNSKPSIVLVHGAFADGSSWSKVIPLLEKDGYAVTAVQINLTSIEEDAAITRRVIDAQPGPVVVVAHSWGGAVATTAAAGAANVKLLVYVSAFAPDAGEIALKLLEQYPTDSVAAFRPDSAGYAYIDRAKFHEIFCADVPEDEARVLAATQRPAQFALFQHVFGEPAWKTIPAWFLVAKQDRTVPPDLERMFAARMKATTREFDSSHVPFVSQPHDFAKFVIEAAETIAMPAGAGS
jgi:pimeloyl-ACP methyl ester carboxylesterase